MQYFLAVREGGRTRLSETAAMYQDNVIFRARVGGTNAYQKDALPGSSEDQKAKIRGPCQEGLRCRRLEYNERNITACPGGVLPYFAEADTMKYQN